MCDKVQITLRPKDPVVIQFLDGLENGSRAAALEAILGTFLRMGQMTPVTSLQRAVLAAESSVNQIAALWPDTTRKGYVWAGLTNGEQLCLSPHGDIEEAKGC